MVALHILKFHQDLSDEDVVAGWRSSLGSSGAESMLKGIFKPA
jgi:hypothetical protein